MVEVMKITGPSFKRPHAGTATVSAPNPAAGHCRPSPPLETLGHPQASPGQSFVGSLLLSSGSWCTRFCLCPPRVCFPVLGKFWQLYAGVNGDLFPEGLCHTQVCGTQSPCPCGRPLLTRISSGDTQTQFCELGTSIMPIFLVKTQEEKLGQTSPYIVQREFKHVHASL